MPIDDCSHAFEDLALMILPQHFARLEEAIKTPFKASDLVGFKSTSREALAKAGRPKDFSGCYVFLDGTKPIYVGISRKVIKRLIQHLNFNSHYSASLVYRLACADHEHDMKRDEAMKHEKFLAAFIAAQTRLRTMNVACVEIDNPLELYVLEVYAAMKLDTHPLNTFRTH